MSLVLYEIPLENNRNEHEQSSSRSLSITVYATTNLFEIHSVSFSLVPTYKCTLKGRHPRRSLALMTGARSREGGNGLINRQDNRN